MVVRIGKIILCKRTTSLANFSKSKNIESKFSDAECQEHSRLKGLDVIFYSVCLVELI